MYRSLSPSRICRQQTLKAVQDDQAIDELQRTLLSASRLAKKNNWKMIAYLIDMALLESEVHASKVRCSE